MGKHGQKPVLLLIGGLQCGAQFRQFVTLGGDLAALVVQIEKNVRLGTQDVCLDRLLDEIDGAGFISAKPARFIA